MQMFLHHICRSLIKKKYVLGTKKAWLAAAVINDPLKLAVHGRVLFVQTEFKKLSSY